MLEETKVEDKWEICNEYAMRYISHSNGEVRAAAYSLIIELYQQVGKPLISEYINVKP